MNQGKHAEGEAILRKIYSPEEVEGEIQALKESVEAEIKESESSDRVTMVQIFKTKTVRRALYAGMGLQIFQQFVGINTVMYYSPTIVQLAGIASNQTALLLSLITAGLNAFGSIISIYFIDRTGRKKLALISLTGVAVSLALLTVIFHETEMHSPAVSNLETKHFNGTICPNYSADLNDRWTCMKCLKATADCGFCASSFDKVRYHTQ